MCGEKPHHSAAALSRSGSPPHVRGKVQIGHLIKVCLRITPACAGKSKPHPWWRRPEWDHPRVCGEKGTKTVTSADLRGSPPHVRGKDPVTDVLGSLFGITPACAGKSPSGRGTTVFFWDHPRMCGEKSTAASRTKAETGSPPHVRGKEKDLFEILSYCGITPACAGKSTCITVGS